MIDFQSNSKKVYLAVDLGAESGRVLAGEFDGNKLQLQVVHSFPQWTCSPEWFDSLEYGWVVSTNC